MDFTTYQQWFDDYTDQFLYHDSEKDYPFIIKKIHTHRVCDAAVSICNDISVSQKTRYIAQLVALFHDLGRFVQYATYGTFRDSDSVNHAVQSIKDLARYRVLKNLSLKQRRIICNAIRYHNAAFIPHDQKDEETLFHIRLIRDADKIDIWRVFMDYFENRDKQKSDVIELNIPNEPEISDTILNALFNKKIALITDMKTLNDFRLIQLGWIYDLNFRYSIQHVIKYNVIEKLTKDLPKRSEIQDLVQKLIHYCDTRLTNHEES